MVAPLVTMPSVKDLKVFTLPKQRTELFNISKEIRISFVYNKEIKVCSSPT